MDRRATIENLRQELEALTIASKNIERAIRDLEQQEQQLNEVSSADADATACPLDRDGNKLKVGQEIKFLTRGKFSSTRGTVTRFSRNNIRVFAIDSKEVEVSRAPRNVRIIK